MLISNLQASNVAAGINVALPRALDGALYAVMPSELPFLDVEAIVAEIVSMAVLIQVSLKLSASFRAIFTVIMIMNENMHESMKKVHEWFLGWKRINFGVPLKYIS